MRVTLADLPLPPLERAGWPWTAETQALPAKRPDGSDWPLITIVTPSYNQGRFIEETIRSVLLQGYPNLEYMVIDGGSTDETVAILECYDPFLTHWESRPDRGQSHAINKGLSRATGEIFQWINSDDVLLKGVLGAIGLACDGSSAIAGGVEHRAADRTFVNRNASLTAGNVTLIWSRGKRRPSDAFLCDTPGIWLRTMPLRDVGGVPEHLNYIFDIGMLALYLERNPLVTYIERPIVFFRYHDQSKTISQNSGFFDEYRLMLGFVLSRARTRLIRRLAVETIEFFAREADLNEDIARFMNSKYHICDLLHVVFLSYKYRKIRSLRFFGGMLRNVYSSRYMRVG